MKIPCKNLSCEESVWSIYRAAGKKNTTIHSKCKLITIEEKKWVKIVLNVIMDSLIFTVSKTKRKNKQI